MVQNLKTNKILWNITTALALVAAIVGVISPHIYDKVFAPEFIPGALPQDILTVVICIALFVMIAKTKENSIKMQVVILGILGSFFYLYGIFTIERVYNFLYILYAAIFSMSFWSVLYGLMNLKKEVFEKVKISNGMKWTTAISGMTIATIFTVLWIAALIPIMRENNRIEYLYSIYLLDLCFVMPAFFTTAVMSLQKKGMGIVLSPAVFILGIFVIFPLGLAEVARPYYGQAINYGPMIMSFVFSAFMLLIAVLHLKKLKTID